MVNPTSDDQAALEHILAPLRAEFGARLITTPVPQLGSLPGVTVDLSIDGADSEPLMLQYGVGVYRFGPRKNLILDTFEDGPVADDDAPWVLETIRQTAQFGAYLIPSRLGPFRGRDAWYVPADSQDKSSFLEKWFSGEDRRGVVGSLIPTPDCIRGSGDWSSEPRSLST